MAKLIYTNERGDSIELGQSAPFFVTSIEGFSNVDNIIDSYQSPNQDGESVTNEKLAGRHMVIQGEYYTRDRQDGRNKLIKVFNPKLEGILKYINGSFIKEIKCKPEKSPVISSTNKSTVPYLINLYASNPFWLDDFETSEEIITWIGGMTFPLRLPTAFSMAGGKIINIINDGDVETPIRLEVTGTATNPKVLNRTTGEFIKVNRTLTSDDTLVITTDFGNKRVELNEQNVFNYIDLNSTFFNLVVGDNVIELTTEDENDNTNIKISYRNRYIGV